MKKVIAATGIGAALIAGPLAACGSAGATPTTNRDVCDVIAARSPGALPMEAWAAAMTAVERAYDVNLDKADAIVQASVDEYCPQYAPLRY